MDPVPHPLHADEGMLKACFSPRASSKGGYGETYEAEDKTSFVVAAYNDRDREMLTEIVRARRIAVPVLCRRGYGAFAGSFVFGGGPSLARNDDGDGRGASGERSRGATTGKNRSYATC